MASNRQQQRIRGEARQDSNSDSYADTWKQNQINTKQYVTLISMTDTLNMIFDLSISLPKANMNILFSTVSHISNSKMNSKPPAQP